MAVSKSQQKAVHKYVKANYDRMELTVPKGRKELIKAHAEAHSESVNGFINRAIDYQIEQGASIRPSEVPTTQDGTGVVYLPSETINAAQQAAEAVGETVPVFIDRAIEETADRDALSRGMEGGKSNE